MRLIAAFATPSHRSRTFGHLLVVTYMTQKPPLRTRFGNWHTIYMRMNRWSKSGVLDRVFEHLQRQSIVRLRLEAVSLDSKPPGWAVFPG